MTSWPCAKGVGVTSNLHRQLLRLRIALRAIFHIAVASGRPSSFPVLRVVGIDSRAVPQSTEKGALRWIHHDPDMPAPHHQIAWLRTSHPLEPLRSRVKIGRTCVRVRETSPVVYGVYQVRTVTLASGVDVRVEG